MLETQGKKSQYRPLNSKKSDDVAKKLLALGEKHHRCKNMLDLFEVFLVIIFCLNNERSN